MNEYEIVLQMLIAFMKHVVSLQINVRNLLQQYKANKAPKDVVSLFQYCCPCSELK